MPEIAAILQTDIFTDEEKFLKLSEFQTFAALDLAQHYFASLSTLLARGCSALAIYMLLKELPVIVDHINKTKLSAADYQNFYQQLWTLLQALNDKKIPVEGIYRVVVSVNPAGKYPMAEKDYLDMLEFLVSHAHQKMPLLSCEQLTIESVKRFLLLKSKSSAHYFGQDVACYADQASLLRVLNIAPELPENNPLHIFWNAVRNRFSRAQVTSIFYEYLLQTTLQSFGKPSALQWYTSMFISKEEVLEHINSLPTNDKNFANVKALIAELVASKKDGSVTTPLGKFFTAPTGIFNLVHLDDTLKSLNAALQKQLQPRPLAAISTSGLSRLSLLSAPSSQVAKLPVEQKEKASLQI